MGLPDSRGVSRDPHYLGTCSRRSDPFSPTRLSRSVVTRIQRGSAKGRIGNLPKTPYGPANRPLNPASTTDMAYHVLAVWAVPRSLAATDGIDTLFLFLEVLRCFNSLGSPSPAYVFSRESPGFARRGCPIRKSTGSLLSNKPWLIAGKLRPSSPLGAKASTARP